MILDGIRMGILPHGVLTGMPKEIALAEGPVVELTLSAPYFLLHFLLKKTNDWNNEVLSLICQANVD